MAGRIQVKLDRRVLDRAADRAFRKTVQKVEGQLRQAFEDPVWNWKGQTQRHNGELVGSPRNIVDTGKLRDSQQPARYPRPLAAQIAWSADHAAAVFLGAVYRTRDYSLPARNLPRRVLNEMDVAELFNQALAEEL